MKQLKLLKGFRLNKIINKEELTKQLTFHSRVQVLSRILLLIIFKRIVAQATPSIIQTRQSLESPTWFKESGGGGIGIS